MCKACFFMTVLNVLLLKISSHSWPENPNVSFGMMMKADQALLPVLVSKHSTMKLRFPDCVMITIYSFYLHADICV